MSAQTSPQTTLSWHVQTGDGALSRSLARLRTMLEGARLTGAADADVLVVWADSAAPDQIAQEVSRRARSGGVTVLAGPTLEGGDPDGALAELAGLLAGPPSPAHDARIRPGPQGAALAGRLLDHAHVGLAHLGEHIHLYDRVLTVEKIADDVEVLLTAQLGLAEHAVATWRPSTRVLTWTPGTNPETVAARGTVRALTQMLRHVLGLGDPPAVRVGLLGYGAIGHEHNRAVQHTPGLHLAAVADASPERLAAALDHAPHVRTHTDGEALLTDDLDLVVVSTPPNTHAQWALQALRAGRNVLVEKPFAISTAESDEILSTAADRGLYAAVYQNRRFDPDHLAIRRAVRSGRIGEVFHLEAFVGGYGHPCNLWHSDDAVSGGAFYDWGAHTLDQILDLLPEPVESVTAVEHKRVWLDVTNADHSRVTLRLASGAEASFVYSDLAAALKPRWYVLGTRGAIVGHWRTERVVARSDIGTLAEDVLSPADSPPLLDLHSPDGSVTRLATPPERQYAFHAEVADALQLGLPASVTGAQSRRVLAVMEAARFSAADGGRPVTPR